MDLHIELIYFDLPVNMLLEVLLLRGIGKTRDMHTLTYYTLSQ